MLTELYFLVNWKREKGGGARAEPLLWCFQVCRTTSVCELEITTTWEGKCYLSCLMPEGSAPSALTDA